ncbi:MAG: hypothetical protein J6V68_02075 [Clostridia bacterium]|nr:hypothetical protein [Clostridia bacterium]
MLITVSERAENSKNLTYIQNNISELLRQSSAVLNISTDDKRVTLNIDVPNYYYNFVKNEIAGYVCDVLTIFYKYSYIKKRIFTSGLSTKDNEILLTGIISADYETDKKYALNLLGFLDTIAIDGVFNFKLKGLKEKWSEIISVLPQSFSKEQLKEFIYYLQKDLTEKVFIENNKLFSANFKETNRSTLISDEFDLSKEILLANAGKIVVLSGFENSCDEFLKIYYGDKVEFCKRV